MYLRVFEERQDQNGGGSLAYVVTRAEVHVVLTIINSTISIQASRLDSLCFYVISLDSVLNIKRKYAVEHK